MKTSEARLRDVQSSPDTRELAIDRVGVKSLRYPILVRSLSGAEVPSIAEFDMYVGLPPDVKGTHMSRFLEVLEAHTAPVDYDGVRRLLRTVLARLGAVHGEIEMRFPYFIRKRAPVSGVESALDHQVTLLASIDPATVFRLRMQVVVAATSLCPCSKEISKWRPQSALAHHHLGGVARADGDRGTGRNRRTARIL